MRIDHFRFAFNQLNGFYLTNHVIFFRKPCQLWNEKTGETVFFRNVDEALSYVLDGETVRQIIERTDKLYIPFVDGGRGSSGEGGNQKFKFGHAKDSGKGGEHGKLPAAAANTKIKSKSFEGALAEFKRNHLLANKEFAYEVDDQGFVHQYVQGSSHSVGIWGSNTSRNRSTMIIHNHPSGGAFSDNDLIVTSMDRRSKGIIASGKNYDYKFAKGSHFKADKFIKAVKNANMPGKTYDDAVDKWLKRNQKKYGYQYSRTKN